MRRGGRRSRRRRARGRGGIVELVVGSGGHAHYPVDRTRPALRFADDTRTGALRLVLRPGRADYAFVGVGGRVLDRGTVRCTPA